MHFNQITTATNGIVIAIEFTSLQATHKKIWYMRFDFNVASNIITIKFFHHLVSFDFSKILIIELNAFCQRITYSAHLENVFACGGEI